MVLSKDPVFAASTGFGLSFDKHGRVLLRHSLFSRLCLTGLFDVLALLESSTFALEQSTLVAPSDLSIRVTFVFLIAFPRLDLGLKCHLNTADVSDASCSVSCSTLKTTFFLKLSRISPSMRSASIRTSLKTISAADFVVSFLVNPRSASVFLESSETHSFERANRQVNFGESLARAIADSAFFMGNCERTSWNTKYSRVLNIKDVSGISETTVIFAAYSNSLLFASL